MGYTRIEKRKATRRKVIGVKKDQLASFKRKRRKDPNLRPGHTMGEGTFLKAQGRGQEEKHKEKTDGLVKKGHEPDRTGGQP